MHISILTIIAEDTTAYENNNNNHLASKERHLRHTDFQQYPPQTNWYYYVIYFDHPLFLPVPLRPTPANPIPNQILFVVPRTSPWDGELRRLLDGP